VSRTEETAKPLNFNCSDCSLKNKQIAKNNRPAETLNGYMSTFEWISQITSLPFDVAGQIDVARAEKKGGKKIK
jgi:hypothetical protein